MVSYKYCGPSFLTLIFDFYVFYTNTCCKITLIHLLQTWLSRVISEFSWLCPHLYYIDMQKQIADSPVLIATVRKKCEKGSLREADSQGNCVCSQEWSAEVAGRWEPSNVSQETMRKRQMFFVERPRMANLLVLFYLPYLQISSLRALVYTECCSFPIWYSIWSRVQNVGATYHVNYFPSWAYMVHIGTWMVCAWSGHDTTACTLCSTNEHLAYRCNGSGYNTTMCHFCASL